MTPQSHMEQLLAAEVVRGWCRRQAEANPRFSYDGVHSGGSSVVRFAVSPAGTSQSIACEVRVGDGGDVSLVRGDTSESAVLSKEPFEQHGLEKALDEALASIVGTYVEGAATTVTLDRYERSRTARQACLAAHGTSCAICGFDFGKAYGPEFAGIIQVHHIVPVSERGGAYEVDPVRDLIPVCPNCHVALHSKPGGTYTPDELRSLLVRRHQT